MQITVTNTSAPLTSLLSASDLTLAETNRGGCNEYEILAYNADSTSTDIVYYTFGETATASEGIPLFALVALQVQETPFLYLQAI
jgi:hypothetical protein